MSKLIGKRVLVITSNAGVEQDEYAVPVQALRESGAEVVHAAPTAGVVHSLVNDSEQGTDFEATVPLKKAKSEDFDLLLVPGGTINADTLRRNEHALALVTEFARSGRPVAAICHAPWLLVEAELLLGKTLTSYASIQTDVRNAGGAWIDERIVSDDADGWTLITSREPGDLKHFVRGIEDALS